MLGGSFIDSSRSPIAFIAGADFTCSGTLIGPREILTAAHCIEGRAVDYIVYVGGANYAVSEMAFNSLFDPDGSTESSNSQFDVGMILLSQNVTNVPPIPIASSLPLTPGISGTVFGFGTNELGATDQPFINEKAGRILLSSVADGMFSSSMEDTGVTVCSGDSGGPVISTLNGVPMVIGVVSTGDSQNTANDVCVEGYGGSNFVDIQSASATAFLSTFPGVMHSGNGFSFIASRSAAVEKQVRKGLKFTSLKRIKSLAKTSSLTVSGLKPYADGTRGNLLSRTITSLGKSSSSRKIKDAVRNLKAAVTYLKQLSALR